jgi:putative tricarboxylic transport membrane protein
MMPTRREFLLAVAALCAPPALTSRAARAQSTWKPERSVEMIVWAAAGGGSDKPARTIQRLAQEKRLLDVPMTVVNRPGGSGTVGWNYMNQFAGNGHYLSLVGTVLISNRINGVSPLSYEDATPIALLGHDYIIFAVRTDSPIRSGPDLIERLRKDVNALSFGITTRGGAGHIALGQALRGTGVDPRRAKIVVFKSGGEVATAVLGGHIDVAVSVAPSLAAHQQAGGIRTVAVAAPRRLPGAFANAPTWREQGIDSVKSNWRAIVGPKGLSSAQVEFWNGFFDRLTAQPEWKEDVASSLQEFIYLPSRETGRFFESQHRELSAILTELGIAKQS